MTVVSTRTLRVEFSLLVTATVTERKERSVIGRVSYVIVVCFRAERSSIYFVSRLEKGANTSALAYFNPQHWLLCRMGSF